MDRHREEPEFHDSARSSKASHSWLAGGCVGTPFKASPKVEKTAKSSSLTFEKSPPSNPAKAEKHGPGRARLNESLGFRLCPRHQRCQCAGIACRSWREGKGAVGRPEPDSRDESAADLRPNCSSISANWPSCAALRCNGETLVIGALTRHADLLKSSDIAKRAPLLRGGRGARRSPRDPQPGHHRRQPCAGRSGSELPACMLALGATIVVRGPGGERRIAAEEFFTGIYETKLAPQDLLVAIELPVARTGAAHFFQEFARRHGDYAIVGLAAQAVAAGRRFRRSAARLFRGRRQAGSGEGRRAS